MNKDLPDLEVTNVTVVIKPEGKDQHWSVHLVNDNDFAINNILVASKGYSDKTKSDEQTSVLRHFIEELAARSAAQIELIDPAVFHMFNEYGVSYYIDKDIYFKKFVFVPDSILEDNLTHNAIMASRVIEHS